MQSSPPEKAAQKMGVQPHLTLCPAPVLDWSREGTPASQAFGDIYFSVEGGLEETRAVYLKACGLPERWSEPQFQRRSFIIGELGFGTGLNFLAAWQLWSQTRRAGQRLHFVSIEKFPFSKEALAQALESWPELAGLAAQLLERWPGRVRGAHTLHLPSDVTLTLIHDDAAPALSGLSMKADAWFLDGFSPARNPQMWTPSLLARVGALSSPGARIGTFTAAGAVRSSLAQAGFDVRKTQGFGRKRHRIEAVMPTAAQADKDRGVIRPVIVGAGIAGLCLVDAFARRGISAAVIDPNDGTAASANAAAIIKPRLDRQDSPLARFALSAYLYALQFYQGHGAVLSRGVTHAPQSPQQQLRYAALGETAPLPPGHMHWDADLGVMQFPLAQVISPRLIKQGLMPTSVHVGRAAAGVGALGEGSVSLENGEIITGSPIIIAVGAGARMLSVFDEHGLRYSRGQISWASPLQGPLLGSPPGYALTYGGYAVPLEAENLTMLGATHARLDDKDPYLATARDDAHNFEAFRQAAGRSAIAAGRPSRASVRVNSKTTWPYIARLGEQMFAMTGLGSRGFVFAPLMAELLAAKIMGEPWAAPEKLIRPQN